MLIIDFDQTVTVLDTLGIIINLPRDGNLSDFDVFNLPSNPPWDELSRQYFQEVTNHWKSYPTTRSTFHDELIHWARSEAIEHESLERVGDSGLLAGLSREVLHRAGKTLRHQIIRPGCIAFLRKWKILHSCFKVLSVNWSPDFIRGVLEDLVDMDDIISNDLIFDDEDGLSTGYIHERLLTATDKQLYITGESIYIGDSKNDLPALLSAKHGIIFGADTSLLDMCAKFAFKVTDDLSTLPRPEPPISLSIPRQTSSRLFLEGTVTPPPVLTNLMNYDSLSPALTSSSEFATPNRSGAVTPQQVETNPVYDEEEHVLYRVDSWTQISSVLL